MLQYYFVRFVCNFLSLPPSLLPSCVLITCDTLTPCKLQPSSYNSIHISYYANIIMFIPSILSFVSVSLCFNFLLFCVLQVLPVLVTE